MITVTEAFEKFRQRLELSDTERANAIRRHTELRECIRGTFAVDRDFLTGSYDRHTKTKPLKDVDIFFALSDKEKEWRDKPGPPAEQAVVLLPPGNDGNGAGGPGPRAPTGR